MRTENRGMIRRLFCAGIALVLLACLLPAGAPADGYEGGTVIVSLG